MKKTILGLRKDALGQLAMKAAASILIAGYFVLSIQLTSYVNRAYILLLVIPGSIALLVRLYQIIVEDLDEAEEAKKVKEKEKSTISKSDMKRRRILKDAK